MNIALTPEQETWIREHFSADGLSVEAAVRQIVDDRIAMSDLEMDDLGWALPLVDEALADIARGETLSLAEIRENQKRLLQSLEP